MAVKTFSKNVLVEELDLPYNGDIVKSDNIVETSRWSEIHELVFEHEGKFWETSYSVGLTEYQDESPWEFEDEIKCTEVELKEVMVKQWVPVE